MDKRWRPATFARLALALVLALSLSGLLTYGVSGAYGAEPGKASNKIISFERINPAYTECVSYGTEREKLSLPKALRAVCELPEPVKLNKEAEDSDEPQNRFQQTAPAADDQGDFDYYWYGYVAPRNELELRAADQLVIYTIYYADGNQAWRVHGTYDGLNEGFYACDEQGNLTGIVVDVPVTWKGNYQPTQEGIYSFAAKAEGFKYNGVAPAAEVTVCEEGIDPYGQTECDHDEGECDGDHEGEAHAHEGEAYREDAPAREDAPIKPLALEALAAECTCDVANGETNDEAQTTHAENCPLYTPECTCDDVENGHSSECPCFEALADCECGIPATSNPWQHNEGCPLWGEPECTCEGDEHDPLNEECPLYDPTLFAFFDEDVPAGPLTEEVADEDEDIAPLGIGPNGGGTNDVAQDDWMLARAPTSGNEQYYNTQYNNDVRLPGIWIDYVNTIWLNKGVNKFDWTPAAETNALNNWVWGGGISNTTGNPQTTALAYAARNGNTLTVYSGEQLRWALTNVGTAAAGTQTGGTAAQGTATNRIELGANINLNGNVRNWTTIYRTDGATITLTSTAGNHFTIYNMGIFQDTFGNSVGLYCSGQNSGGVAGNPGTLNAVRNFERFSMETCKVVAGQTMTMYGTDRIPTDIAGTSVLGQHTSQRGNIYDVHVLKSLVFGDRRDYPNETSAMGSNGSGSTFGTQLFMTGISNATTAGLGSSTISNSSVEEGFVYGREHVISFMRGIRSGSVDNCYAFDNLICGTAQHSAAFMSCATRSATATITNCFSSAEMYGSLQVSGFVAFYDPSNVTNCYSTGKLEGYQYLGGFYTAANSANGVTIERCYSTTLVGLRTNPARQGGFYADMYNGQASAAAQTRTSHELRDIYAAGEVGNYDVDLNAPVNVGGFASMKQDLSRIITANGSDTPNNRIQYCYYDKQTTAMREWTVGTTKDYMAPAGTSYNGVRGVLTSTTDKAGTGLASGTFGPASDDGFRGFSNNAQWSYQSQHYPQLRSHAAPTTGDGWLAKELATVEAWSKASTATVFLDTWGKGYEWNSNGVRTPDKVLWNARDGGSNHLGGIYTYDTVRDIITDFPITKVAANSTSWEKMIPGGAPSLVNSGISGDPGSITTDHITIGDTDRITINHPGLDWVSVNEFVAGNKGHRPLRLIAYMSLYAGEDKTLMSGDTYNHRPDVEMAMMDNLKDNMIVGLDDAKIWSESFDMGYPSVTPITTPSSPLVANSTPVTTKYYFAPSDWTHFTAGENAWVNTDIWRAQKDPTGMYYVDKDGNVLTEDYDPIYGDIQLEPQYLVGVVGPGTNNNTTLDEKMWNGQNPLYSGMASENKYIVTYYWVLDDGRYRVDEKVITIKPTEYDLNVNIFNNRTNAPESRLLEPTASQDDGPNLGYTYTGTTAQSASALDNPQATNMSASWKKTNESVKVKKIKLTMRERDGSIAGTAEISADSLVDGAEIEIPLDYYFFEEDLDDQTNIIRTVMYHASATVTYTVMLDDDGGYYLHFNKMTNPPAGEVAYVQWNTDSTGIVAERPAYVNDINHHITVDIYVDEINELQVEKNLTEPADKEETFVFKVEYRGQGTEPGAVERTMFATITIPAGGNYGRATFIDMPYGYYTVTELESNWTYTLLTDRLESDHVPGAYVSVPDRNVTLWAEDSSALFTYWNERNDVPWLFNKNRITNDMPPASAAR